MLKASDKQKQSEPSGYIEMTEKLSNPTWQTASSYLPLVLAISYYLFNVSFISIKGDFPINDDYVYGLSVQHFLKTGDLQLYASGSACYLHILTGALGSIIFGFSFEVLRSINLLFGFLSLIGTYLVIRELKIDRVLAGFAACVYAVNPLTTNLQFSFMTDTAAQTYLCYYLLFFLKGIKKSSNPFFVLSGLMLTACVLTRQSNVIFTIPSLIAIIYLAKRTKIFWSAIIMTVLLPVATMLITDHMMEQSAQMVEAYQYHKDLFKNYISYSLSAPFALAKVFLLKLGVVGVYYGLFCLPLLISTFVPGKSPKEAKFNLTASGLIIAAISIAFVYQAYFNNVRIPDMRSLWNLIETGASSLIGQLESVGPELRDPITFAAWLSFTSMTAVLILSGVKVFKQLGKDSVLTSETEDSDTTLPRAFTFLVLVTALAFTTINASIRSYDRYLLDSFIPLLICLAIGFSVLKLKPQPLLTLLFLFLLGFETTKQQYCYLNWNRARWQALEMLEASKVPSNRIDGGAEYNLYRDITLWNCFVIGDGKHYLPLKYRGRFPGNRARWWPVKNDDYVIALEPMAGYKEIGTVPFKTLGDWKHKEILILKHNSVKGDLNFARSSQP